MTRVDWPEYRRRLEVRFARRAYVDRQAGWTGAPVRLWHHDLGAGDADGGGQTVAANRRSITIRTRGRR